MFLEGGGYCADPSSCAGNPSSFGASDFASAVQNGGFQVGIFDRTKSQNPVWNWSHVFVPYCTGDIYLGNTTATVQGVGPQQFVGYADIALYLQRIVPTFPNVTQVLLAGASAGGFGATDNYLQVARAFGSVPVVLLDDSGPNMEDPYLTTCQQTAIETLYGTSATVGVACGSACSTPSRFFLDLLKHSVATYPNTAFALVESTDDSTITSGFGMGQDDCMGTQPLDAGTFTAGLDDIRTQLAPLPNFGSFIFAGTDHTTIQSTAFYTRTTTTPDGGTVALTDWIAALLATSNVTNEGP